MREEVLYEILLGMHKSYDVLDRVHFLYILASYGVGPQAISLLCRYWNQLTMDAWD